MEEDTATRIATDHAFPACPVDSLPPKLIDFAALLGLLDRDELGGIAILSPVRHCYL